MRTARGILIFVNVAELRVGSKQLPLLNRGLIKAAAARGDLAEEWVWNLSQQRVTHGEVLGIDLIQIQAAGINVDPMIANVGDINYVIGRRRILESVHPLLIVIRLSVP